MSFETSARFLTITEAAAALRVSTATVFRLVAGGELPAVRDGASVLVQRSYLERRLATHGAS
jgi:excisionase family DNA binding protein